MGHMQDKYDATMNTMGELKERTPDQMTGFHAMHTAIGKDGAVSGKIKEAIALGIAVKAQCEHCIAFHTKKCVDAGYSREEVLEIAWIGVLMGGGPALMYMDYVVQAVDEFFE